MYKIYINDLPIFLFHRENDEILPDVNIKTPFIPKAKNLLNYIDMLEKQKPDYKGVALICADVEQAFKQFASLYQTVVAAGGVVKNKNGEILYIYRRNKWDLPKGVVEKNESYENAALREVAEETGIKGLKIGKKLTTTYHTYKLDGKRVLKPTHWFSMHYEGDYCELVPQLEEEIEKVQWMGKEQFNRECSDKTYKTIYEVINGSVDIV